VKIGSALLIALAGFLVSSASAPFDRENAVGSQFIPFPNDPEEGLIVPPDSLVWFRGFGGKYGEAQFDGRFVLTGTVIYGCAIDCEEKPRDRFLRVDVVPDPAVAARLPHWKLRQNDMRIVIDPPERFVRTITTPGQRAALRSGNLADVRWRIAIVVDHFETGIVCDSASFTARFVSTAAPPRFAKIEQNGDYGCG
jgi:hypothetical protein